MLPGNARRLPCSPAIASTRLAGSSRSLPGRPRSAVPPTACQVQIGPEFEDGLDDPVPLARIVQDPACGGRGGDRIERVDGRDVGRAGPRPATHAGWTGTAHRSGPPRTGPARSPRTWSGTAPARHWRTANLLGLADDAELTTCGASYGCRSVASLGRAGRAVRRPGAGQHQRTGPALRPAIRFQHPQREQSVLVQVGAPSTSRKPPSSSCRDRPAGPAAAGVRRCDRCRCRSTGPDWSWAAGPRPRRRPGMLADGRSARRPRTPSSRVRSRYRRHGLVPVEVGGIVVGDQVELVDHDPLADTAQPFELVGVAHLVRPEDHVRLLRRCGLRFGIRRTVILA